MMYRNRQCLLWCLLDLLIFAIFVFSRIHRVNSKNAETQHRRSDRSPLSSSRSQPQQEKPIITTTVTWEEIRNDDWIGEDSDSTTIDMRSTTVPPRRRMSFWGDRPFPWKRDQHVPGSQSLGASTNAKPHPLRTNLWDLNLHWRRCGKEVAEQTRPSLLNAKRLSSHIQLILELDASGYARMRPHDDDHARSSHVERNLHWFPMIGTWQLDPGSLVTWSVPDENNSNDYWYEFRAHFHVNPFGKHPKMIRGTVVRHDCEHSGGQRKKQWFPPVVASFTAVGCGPDTADLSYRERKPPRQV